MIKVYPTRNTLNILEQERSQGLTASALMVGCQKAVPDRRAGYRECPASIQVEPVARHHQQMTTG